MHYCCRSIWQQCIRNYKIISSVCSCVYDRIVILAKSVFQPQGGAKHSSPQESLVKCATPDILSCDEKQRELRQPR